MDNKYKQLMSNIEVSDEMRQRILQNIGEMDIKPRATRITPVNARRKATVSRIIGIVAAAGIVLSIGGVILFKYASGGATKSADMARDYTVEAEATVAEGNNSVNMDMVVGEPAEAISEDEDNTSDGKVPQAAGGNDNLGVKNTEDNHFSGVYAFKNGQFVRGGDGSSVKVDKIIYVDEDGNEYTLTDPESISKILGLHVTKDDGDGSDSVELTLYVGDESGKVEFQGSDVSTIINIIKENAVVSKKQ